MPWSGGVCVRCGGGLCDLLFHCFHCGLVAFCEVFNLRVCNSLYRMISASFVSESNQLIG